MITALLSGVLLAEYLVIALFFLRFWNRAKDRLFVLFAAAFVVLAGQRLAIALTREVLEHQAPLYLVRLLAFLMIAFAIIDKNRR